MKKSSACGNNNTCIHVGMFAGNEEDPDLIKVSKSPDISAPGLMFSGEEWDAFVAGVKAGEFDRETLRAEADRRTDKNWRTR